MASTYSTNLAIELIGTGDQAGAWGNTTNTNLGTLIEQAISGYVTQAVATGTDTSITIPNGSTGVARNMYIELTGTGGTNTNLIVPANKKLYFIYNNSTGAVTVKVAGQTGISVAAAQKKILACNGTDIVEATTYLQAAGGSATLTTLTATSASITNLAVTSLTVSSLSLSNATFTSATITTLKSTSATIDNLASTSANIATLTGTNFSAASLTLTNALKVAQGGTGLSSTPTNGQLLIGNGTGFNLNTLNGGPGVGITNQSGAITITATGTGFIASVSATSPLQSTGVQSVVISIASSTGSGAVVLADSPTMSSATITQLASTSATITTIKGTSASITTITGNLVGNASTATSATTATTATTATNVASGGQINAASATITTITSTSAGITNISATSLTVTNTIAGSISGNAATVTNGVVTTGSYANPSWITSLAASKLTGTVAVANGGTALSSTPSNGQLLIGNGSGYTLAALTAGTGITITNGAGSITITASGTGDVAGPASSTDNAVVRFDGTTGKIIQNSTGVTITDGGVLTTTVDASINGVSVGKGAGSGASNTAIGSTAGDSMTNGYYNVMVGATAGTAVTSGYENTLIGYGAGDTITSGVANSMLGKWSGIDISSGSYNTGVGQLALGNALVNCSNSSALGYNAQVNGSDQVQLGNSSTTTYVYGSVANRASDARDKADIQDTNLGLNFITALRPRMYRWDYREDYRTNPPKNPTPEQTDEWRNKNLLANITPDGTYKRNRFHQGLIAQEVKQVMDTMGVDFAGYQDFKIKGGEDRLTLVYEELIPPLIKAIQELKAEFDEYKRTHP